MEKISSLFLSIAFVVLICLPATAKNSAHSFHNSSDTTEVTTNATASSSDSYVKGVTAMRARSLAGIVLGLLSLGIGWRAKKNSSTNLRPGGRNGAIVALLLGGGSIVYSVIHLNFTAGVSFGSGSGKAGAIVAFILSLGGIALGGWAILQARSDRSV